MLLTRLHIKDKLKNALARSPITILATPSGSGKSRLIDSVFEIDGHIDLHSCVLIRFDERVVNLDTMMHLFSVALEHQIPDDINPYEFIVAKLRSLPPGLVIIIDDLHVLHEQSAALELIANLVNDTRTSEAENMSRWLFGIRDITDLPYGLWHAHGCCTIISSHHDLALEEVDFQLLRATLSLPDTTKISTNARETAIHFSALRLRQAFPNYMSVARNSKQRDAWLHNCDGPEFGEHCICGLATQHINESAESIKADSKEFDPNSISFSGMESENECRLKNHSKAILELLSVLEEDIANSILYCGLLFDLNPDYLQDHVPHVNEALSVLVELDLAYTDLTSNYIKIDRTVQLSLQKILGNSSENIIKHAVGIACTVGFSGADVTRALNLLVARNMWDATSGILAEFGLDLFERDQVNGIISRTLSAFPEDIKIDSPVISGLLGVVTSRVNYSDISESHFKCALENESFRGSFRGAIYYRYVLEVARRGREDTRELIHSLLEYVYSDTGYDLKLQALAHSLAAFVESGSHPDIALGHIDRAMSQLPIFDDAFTTARVLRDCSAALNCLGEYERAISMAKDSLRISVENNFYDLASRTLSTLQDLSYRYEHNLPLAKHYLEVMAHYAERAGESRMILLSWLCRYWLFIESGRPNEVHNSHDNIDRYTMPDDFMQDQIQSCTVPGAAMQSAWKGRFMDAITLVESYAIYESSPEDRAFRWSELCIYFAAEFVLTDDDLMRQRYLFALDETRNSLDKLDGYVLQEGNINFRVAISHIVMGNRDLANTFLPYFSSLSDRDRRAPAMRDMLEQMIQWEDDFGQGRRFAQAKRNLFANDLGGIALLIDALPLPTKIRVD